MLLKDKIKRYYLLLAGIIVLVCAVTGVAVYYHHIAMNRLATLSEVGLGFSDMQAEIAHMRQSAMEMVVAVGTGVPEDDALIIADMHQDASALVSHLQGAIKSLPVDSSLRISLQQISQDVAFFAKQSELVLKQQQVDPAGAEVYLDDFTKATWKVSKQLEPARTLLQKETQQLQAETVRLVDYVGLAIVGLLLGSVVATAMFGAFLRKGILLPLEGAISMARQLSQGKLARGSHDHLSNDELGKLLSLMVHGQQRIHGLIGNAAETVKAGATELSANASELVASMGEQNAHVDAMLTLFDSLSETISTNTLSSQDANRVAQQAESTSEASSAVILQMANAIDDLANDVQQTSSHVSHLALSSANIANIAASIQGVVEQTNLLALNAAIEAARAGESGRGFAVVADEVRKLAGQTGSLAQEIGTLVAGIREGAAKATGAMQSMTQNVIDTSAMAGRSRASVQEISREISCVKLMMTDIAQKLEAQAMSTDDAMRRLREVAGMSQRNHHTVEGVYREVATLLGLTEGLQQSLAA